MEHFTIYTEDNPQPKPEQTSIFHYDEGNWVYTGRGNISVFAFEDEGENVHCWVAEKRRTATFDTVPEDVPFTITNLGRMYA